MYKLKRGVAYCEAIDFIRIVDTRWYVRVCGILDSIAFV